MSDLNRFYCIFHQKIFQVFFKITYSFGYMTNALLLGYKTMIFYLIGPNRRVIGYWITYPNVPLLAYDIDLPLFKSIFISGAIVPTSQQLFDGTYTKYCGGKLLTFYIRCMENIHSKRKFFVIKIFPLFTNGKRI